jgi:hypothetical protein
VFQENSVSSGSIGCIIIFLYESVFKKLQSKESQSEKEV